MKNTTRGRVDLHRHFRKIAAGGAVAFSFLAVSVATAGTWASLAHTAPSSVGTMLLLSDGTVMAQNSGGNVWYRLTPDSHGSYVNGTWSTLATMHDTRLYFSSDVLRDGRVFVAGGEYGTGAATAEVYDPVSNTWTLAPVPTSLMDPTKLSPLFSSINQSFLDSDSKILANGNVLVTPVAPNAFGGTLIYNPTSNTWAAGPTLYRGAYQDEASWVKLPDSSILTIDPFGTSSERYIPSSNTWVNDGVVPVSLYDSFGFELGAAFLLPDGRAFYLGSTGHTALYTPSGTTSPGTWAAGPDLPNAQGTPDAPAAMMANGKVLCAVSPVPTSANHFPSPTSFYEYDPVTNSFTRVNGPTGLTYGSSPYISRMLALPDGTILFAVSGTQLYVYQPAGSPLPAWKPTITAITVNGDGSYHLTGTQLNGISEGAAYGDDAQMDSNYPLVRLTDGNGNVYYARTFNWSSTGVQTGTSLASTEFALPAGLPAGTYSLVVVANGISSDPVSLNTGAALAVSPAGGLSASGPAGGPFNPPSQMYALTNSGTATLSWSASNTANWITLAPTNGTLAAGAGTNVTVTVNANANSLAPGNYSDTVTLTNNTNGAGTTTRPVSLAVNGIAALSVSPASGLASSGNLGGPFSPSSQTYVLTNSGTATVSWLATNTVNWVSLSAAGGTLPVGAGTNVTVSINSAANGLGAGNYSDTVTFTNTTNGAGSTTLGVSLTVNGAAILSVTPANGLSASGNVGGPFSPSSQVYALTNSGSASLNWSASRSDTWVDLSATNGTLAVGAGTSVTVTINAAATGLAAGNYSDTVTFTNTTNGAGSTARGVSLTVNGATIIVDNADVSGVVIVGPWLVVNGTPGFYGSNCLNDGNLSKGSMSVRFTPNLPAAGAWQVYLRWAAAANRASNVPVDIVSSNGSVRVTVNEQANGGQWNLLGTFGFVAGTNGSVTVRNEGTDGYVIADAVEFVYGGAVPAPPAGPTNLTATAVSSIAINLAWADNATNEDGYVVERSGDGVSYQSVTTLGSNVTGYADNGLAASTVYYYRVRAYNAAGGYSGYSNVAQATTTGATTAVIVDNADATGVTIVGSWLVVNGTPGFYGSNCLNDGNLSKGSMSVRFTPNLPAAGAWQVYLRWAALANRASNVPVDIVSSNGSVRVMVNEQVNGGQWNLLGTFGFVAGTNGSVTVRNEGTDGYVIADAVEFVYSGAAPAPPAAPTNLTATAVSSSAINLAWADNATNEDGYVVERSGDGVSYQSVTTLGSNVTGYADNGLAASTVYYYRVRAYNAAGGYSGYSNVAQTTTTGATTAVIVDNADATGVTIVGSWLVVNGTPGFYGSNCLNDGNLSKGSMSVRFTPNLPAAGAWQVYLRWAAAANRASNVPVDIVSSNGSVRVMVNEQVNGGQWNLLGTFGFVAGTNGSVTVRNEGTDGYVIADAVEFVYGGAAPAPPAGPTNLTATAVSSSAINLAWADNATNEDGYVVERSGDGVNYQSVATLGSNVTGYADSGLAASTVYYYRVRAYNTAGGYSGYSNVAQATTTAGSAEIIVDNADASGVVIVGPWLVVNGTPGFYGSNCLNDGNLSKGSMSVRFTPNLPAAGAWQVYLRWAALANRASNVPVDIVSSNGSVRVTVNEQVNGGQWNLLGTYSFVAGTNGSVTVRNDGTDGYVIADAVRLVPSGSGLAAGGTASTVAATGAIADVALSGVSIGTGSGGSSRILADGSWEITGSGSGFGLTDSLYYEQQSISGDFTVMARIESLTSDGAFPQAGLMIREGLAADARLVSVAATGTNQYWAARHTLAGAAMDEFALGSTYVYPNAWVALVRAGDAVTIFTSPDGQSWVEEQTVTVPALAAAVNVGLFLSSGTTGVDAQAVITEFAVTPPGAGPPAAGSPVPPP